MRFGATYDYLCPFACIVHETIGMALRDGAAWDVAFMPFSLSQVHVEEGKPPVWERPLGAPGTRGVRAHAWALAVQEIAPERFLDFHLGLFAARHQSGLDIDDPQVLADVARGAGVDPDRVTERVATGEPVAALGRAHEEAVKRHEVFGVPTIVMGDEAVFVRLMRRDVADLARVIDMVGWTNLNEFKRTTIPR